MWLADQITMHGIGNGSSMLITAGILVSLPKMLVELGKYFLSKDPKENPNYLMPFIGCYSVRYISLGLVGVQLTVCHNQQNLQCSVMSSSIKELYLKHK